MDSSTLLAGSGLSIVGLLFRRRGRPRKEIPPTRFRTVRKFLGKANHEEE
ncbi:MAG: hypothetical protein V3V44_03660 [Anaerolineales bacterium]